MANTLGRFTAKLVKKGVELSFSTSDIYEINIIEDIYSWCIAGNMVFYDKTGYTELLEIAGYDPLVIMYEEEGIKVEKMFIIYDFHKIVEEHQLAPGMNKVKWYFVEPIFISLNHKYYSRAWGENILGSTIIEDISKNMLGIDAFKSFEPTKEKFSNFYMPHWTPAEAIKWLMKRSSGSQSKLPGYLFYSNSQGNNFITLESLITSKVRERDSNNNKVSYIFTGGDDAFNKVLNWYITPPDMDAHIHLAGTTKYGYSFDGKYLHKKEYTYVDTINKYSLLGGTSLFPDISDSRNKITCEGEQSIESIYNIHHDDFIRKYSKQFSAGIVVRGHSRRYAGMLIDILWKSVDSVRKTNKMYEGLYLVRSITHQFTPGTRITPNYRQLMVCLKTGYMSTEGGQLVPADHYVSDVGITKV